MTNERQFTCSFCDKSLSSKERLTKHMELCKSNTQRDEIRNTRIIDYEAKINYLERQLADKTSQLNELLEEQKARKQVLLDISPELIKEKFRGIPDEDLKQGQEGVARFIANNILTNADGEVMYKCVDRHRQKFIYYDTAGKRCVDYNAEYLINNLSAIDDLKEYSKRLYDMDDTDSFLEWTSLVIDLLNIRKQKTNQTFRRHLIISLF
jgi:hypothetical protein